MTHFNINSFEFSEDDFNNEFSKDNLRISKLIQLSESHALIDFLKFENTMMFNSVDALENKLKEFEDLEK